MLQHSSMNIPSGWLSSGPSAQYFPFWLRLSSVVLFIVSIGSLCEVTITFDSDRYAGENLIATLAVALSFAIFLNIYIFLQLHQQNREIDRAFQNADCAFSSIFRNALDGILIIDDEGRCLDVNPAAASMFNVSVKWLIGKRIDQFFADRNLLAKGWKCFLQDNSNRGRLRLIASDSKALFVEFAATANYLPGRHVMILCDVTERTKTQLSLKKSEERFIYMADNIQEIFWMMDAVTQELSYVNRAYATITGQTVESLQANPGSYRELIHPEDRVRVISRLSETMTSGAFDEEFRFIRSDGTVRWIWAKGFPVPADGETRWLVGAAQDITSRKQAEMRIAEQLDAVEAARAEAEALRKATLALSQNLAMDSVLDTLLQCIRELVPFDWASVLFIEDATHVMVARESTKKGDSRAGFVLSALEFVHLQKILFERKPVALPDTAIEPDWRDIPPFDHTRSWMGIPLIASGNVIGILSLSAREAAAFTAEHLRLTRNLAVSAAVAIQNARVHERAAIYASELELRLEELRTAESKLNFQKGSEK